MYLGLDLGTSGVKAILLGQGGELVGQASARVAISHPRPSWSEQEPEDWWKATATAVVALRRDHDLSSVRGIGLSGQMHGAVLLDQADQVLRPAILWNDGRATAECVALEIAEPRSRAITGNLAMPGFTAPKLLWVRRHEPEVFARVRRVLLPKDWLRLHLTGAAISDMSDAAGTLWLDVAARRWSPAMLAACDLTEDRMPSLVEVPRLRGRCGRRWRQTWDCQRASRSRAVAATTRRGLLVSAASRRAKHSFPWGRQASSSLSMPGSCLPPKRPCMLSATVCRRHGIGCRSSSRRPLRSPGLHA